MIVTIDTISDIYKTRTRSDGSSFPALSELEKKCREFILLTEKNNQVQCFKKNACVALTHCLHAVGEGSVQAPSRCPSLPAVVLDQGQGRCCCLHGISTNSCTSCVIQYLFTGED